VSPFPRRLAAFTATLTVAIVAAAGWLALREGMSAAVPLLVFGVIANFCIDRDVAMANGVYVSAVVPNQLLSRPGKLTDEEFARVRVHDSVSVRMLRDIDFLRPIAMPAHSDAMRFNPDVPDHPIEPYVVMVADAYDAISSTRSYRKALPQDAAFQELRDKSGKQFHPACAETLIRAIEKRNEVHGKGHEEESHYAPEVGLGAAGLGDLLPDEKPNK
jgi:hypothetical protein